MNFREQVLQAMIAVGLKIKPKENVKDKPKSSLDDVHYVNPYNDNKTTKE